jgi:hypothetical protein
MGHKPGLEYTLERMDNDLDYTPDNCEWATRQEQNRNHSRIKLTQNDVDNIRSSSLPSRELANEYSVSQSLIINIRQYRLWKPLPILPIGTPLKGRDLFK